MSITALSQQIGYSPSVLSQYLSESGCKYPGDVGKLERRAADFLRSAERRQLIGVPLMECEVSRQIGSAIEAIRRTNDIGLILGDAGVGKTCALALYCEENPTCIMITIPEWAHDMRSVEGRIFAAIAHGDWDGRTKRGDYLAIRLKGSNRLIVVDNAHKLTRPALRGCSISMTPPGAPSPSSETRMSWTKSSITTSGSRASDSKSKSSSSGQPP